MFVFFVAGLFIVSAIVSVLYSRVKALIYIGTISLMLFHQQLIVEIPSFPDFGPFQAVIFAIVLTSIIFIVQNWKFSSSDILIATISILIVLSQYNSQYSELTRAAAADVATSIVLPYVAFKSLLKNGKNEVAFLKVMVYCAVTIVLLGVWEMRMTDNIFKDIASFLDPSKNYSKFAFRFGLVRLHGPFGGHLIASLMLGTCFFMHLTLSKSSLWSKRFKIIPLPFNKPLLFYFILGIGILMPMSRIAAFMAITTFLFYHIISRKLTDPVTIISLSFFLLLFFAGYIYYQSTVSAPVTIRASALRSSTLARERKFDELIPIIKSNPYLGTGKKGNLAERESPTDNAYLYVSYQHGIPAMLAFASMIFFQLFRLIRRGRNLRKKYPIDAIFSFGYASILFFLSLSLTQVVLFRTLGVIFYGFIGLFESHIIAKEGYLEDSLPVQKLLKNKKQRKTLLSQVSSPNFGSR